MFAASSPFDGGVLGLVGSSVETDTCYQGGKTQTFCFTVFNGSTDGEWIDGVTLTFPEDTSQGFPPWIVSSCSYQDATDSIGYPVSLTCTPSGKQVFYTDGDGDGYGEISNGASWMSCVDVYVPPEYGIGGLRYIPWELYGDSGGSVTSERIEIEMCTPLRLTPSQVDIVGCNGMAQSLDFELTNFGAGNNTTVDFIYDAPDAEFSGPTDVQLSEGEVVTFTAQFEPKLCLKAGETVTGTLAVVGGGHADESFVTQAVGENAGWRRRADSPVPSMDNVVVWASHEDGGLWSVGGYGSDGAVQRYDPGNDMWQTFQSEAVITPLIEYPMDGCYGLNGAEEEIIVLFPDTIITGSLHVFNIEHKTWSTQPTPPGYPVEGRWGHDVVSMLQHTGENVCYLSGGSDQEGGGRTRDLWEYSPATNTVIDRGPFPASVWFGFHASWYVPWVGGADGAICVAGGVDHNHIIHKSTQCFYRSSGTFGSLNGDLGELPEPWWGMADGWQVTEHGYELWIANGVAQDGTLLPVSAYIREGMSDFEYGPTIPDGLYRLEGDAWNNQFFTLNGSRGGFWYSAFNLNLALCPTCYENYLPAVLRDYGN
jgi:hypothetical protein